MLRVVGLNALLGYYHLISICDIFKAQGHYLIFLTFLVFNMCNINKKKGAEFGHFSRFFFHDIVGVVLASMTHIRPPRD